MPRARRHHSTRLRPPPGVALVDRADVDLGDHGDPEVDGVVHDTVHHAEEGAADDAGVAVVPEGADEDLPGAESVTAESATAARAPVWTAVMAVLAVALLALIGFGVTLFLQVRANDQQNAGRQAVVAAARTEIANLTTADYQHPQDYVARLRQGSTGDFLDQFTNSANGFTQLLQQGQVKTTGQVAEVGVSQLGNDTAQLSVLADVTVHNTETTTGENRAYRLSVSMIQASGQWLVSNVEFVR